MMYPASNFKGKVISFNLINIMATRFLRIKQFYLTLRLEGQIFAIIF